MREVRLADREDWLKMRGALWPGSPAEHRRDIERFLKGKSKEPLAVFLAAGPDGRAAGFIELSVRAYADGCDTDNVAYVEGWYVRPAWRGKGVGAALVRRAERWARERGCAEMGSDAGLRNALSHKAHKALGFKETARLVCFSKKLRK